MMEIPYTEEKNTKMPRIDISMQCEEYLKITKVWKTLKKLLSNSKSIYCLTCQDVVGSKVSF